MLVSNNIYSFPPEIILMIIDSKNKVLDNIKQVDEDELYQILLNSSLRDSNKLVLYSKRDDVKKLKEKQ